MKNLRHDFWLIGLAVAGLVLTIVLFPKTYPQAGAQGTRSRTDILRQAETVLNQVGFSREGLEPAIEFRINHELLAFGQANFGTAEANQLFARELPAFYWNVRYTEPAKLHVDFSGGAQEERTQKTREKYILGEARLQFDIHGRLLLLEINTKTKPDTVSLNFEEAKKLAFGLLPLSSLADTSGILLEKSKVTYEKSRADYDLSWKVQSPLVGLNAQLLATIQGSHLKSWQLQYTALIAAYNPSRTFLGIGEFLAMVLVIVLMGVFFFKRLRADEISLKAGVPAAIAAGIGLALSILNDPTKGYIEQLIAIIFLAGFSILGFVIVYGTAESLMRTLGHDRVLTFQAIQRGRWWFQPAGESLWRGAALGLVLFGVITVVLNLLGPLFRIYYNPENETLRFYTSFTAPLVVVGENLSLCLFAETTYRLFLISVLSRYFRQSWAVVALATVVSAFGRTHLLELSPPGFCLVVNALLGMALALIYLRFDFLTTLTTALMMPLLLHGFSFLYAGKILSALNGWIILAVPVLFIAGGQIIRRYGRTEIDTRELQPDYLERLAEKERMKRELEIARQVQLSFLPKQIPSLAGLDIAAVCIPANEVGGDYYDFVNFGNGRLGVLIGDVSGKGISAAFYMTLTKGIIKSSVQDSLSPAKVLTRANQLFYENVERGIFVSLIYGVFDLPNRNFTFARAGHNPVLLLRRQQHDVTVILPNGLALGLERGEAFARNIQEQTLVINSGDIFVFYTDGFTEAMNRRNEEFGEARMAEILSDGVKASSQETITHVRNAVQRFIGNAPQHDDMTMVVVKVL